MEKYESRIGFIARVDQTGLGVESAEFVEHMKPVKVLKVLAGDKPQFPDRFSGEVVQAERGIIPRSVLRAFCKDIDVLFAIETPYRPDAFAIAREEGIKSVLRVNYEYLDTYVGENRPDLYVSPVNWNMDHIPKPNLILPFPVCTHHIKYRERKVAKTFLHIGGNKGYMDRNGTNLVKQAMKLLKTRAEIIILDQKVNSVKNYARLYDKGDVLLYPRRHSGQSLVVNEAMAAGMAIMMTDMSPQNQFLPEEILIKPSQMLTIDIKRQIDFAIIDPAMIAKKVDEFYNKNICQISKISLGRATEISWKNLLPIYRKMFSNL